ncbi:hypothetical protein TNCV_1950721 [Trichonephila clavipes]|nr:hypothetical protein TNCV_1950721 [Trichonephila clavipes]
MYSDRLRPLHGRQSSHNNVSLPLLQLTFSSKFSDFRRIYARMTFDRYYSDHDFSKAVGERAEPLVRAQLAYALRRP